MFSDQGTDGIGHSIHVAKIEDEELTNVREYENVLDVLRLGDGTVKFYFENEQKVVHGGTIIRSQVRGIDSSYRYRCKECEDHTTDIISQQDRGESISLECENCGETEYNRTAVDDV